MNRSEYQAVRDIRAGNDSHAARAVRVRSEVIAAYAKRQRWERRKRRMRKTLYWAVIAGVTLALMHGAGVL